MDHDAGQANFPFLLPTEETDPLHIPKGMEDCENATKKLSRHSSQQKKQQLLVTDCMSTSIGYLLCHYREHCSNVY